MAAMLPEDPQPQKRQQCLIFWSLNMAVSSSILIFTPPTPRQPHVPAELAEGQADTEPENPGGRHYEVSGGLEWEDEDPECVGGRSDRQRSHAAPAPLVMEMVRDYSRGKMSEGVEGRMVWRHEISCGRYAVSGPGQERGEGPRVPERSRKEVNQLSCHCASLQPCFSPGKGEPHN